MKRQRGRNRKPGGGGGGGGGGGNNPNRAFESNGPEGVKIRGNAQHVYERYQQLARDAFSSGDRVLAENHLQHAEHYFRVLRTLQPQRPVSEIAARDAFASGFDIDFEDESGMNAVEGGEGEGSAEGMEAADGAEQPREGQYDRQQDRGEYRRDRDYRGGENREFRSDGGRDREFRREPRAEDAGREFQPREDQPREYREGEGRRESRRERFERRREERMRRGEGDQPRSEDDPMAVVEPQAGSLPEPQAAQPAPRAEDEVGSHLPAFLRQSAPAAASSNAADEPPARKPARRRKPAAVADDGEGGAPEAETADEQA